MLAKWGLGAELTFGANQAIGEMTRTQRAISRLKQGMASIGDGVGRFSSGMAQFGLVMAPIVAGFGFAAHQASGMASDLEAQMLTMRVLLGDATKAQSLVDQLTEEANKTPFESGELIESSKRLLRLTGDNVDKNLEMLRVMETMAALNPTKTLTDATEALLDASSGGGFERLKEFGISFRAEDFAATGKPGGEAWAEAVFGALQGRMKELTRGEDLVGALGQTFKGRSSTFADVFNNLFRQVGKVINENVGELFGPIGDWVTAQIPDILGAVKIVADGVKGALASVRPYLTQLQGWWESLGSEGRQKLIAFALGFVTLMAVVLPVGGAIAAIVTAVGGLVTAATALWPILTGIAGALSAEAILIAAAAMGLLAAEVGLLFGAFRESGEGPLDFFQRLAGEGIDRVVAAFQWLREVTDSLFGPMLARVLPALQAGWERLQWPLRELGAQVEYLWSLFTGGDSAQFMHFLDQVGWRIGGLLVWAIEQATRGIEVMLGALRFVVQVLSPVVLWFGKLGEYLVALVSGSMNAEQALVGFINLIGAAVVAVIGMLLMVLLGAVESVLHVISTIIHLIPGAGKFITDATGDLGGDAIGRLRKDIGDQIAAGVAGVDVAQGDRDSARAGASSPTVVAKAGDVKTEVTVVAPVKVDGQEIARATGAASVRSGERGKGPAMPATQRGKVLRSGLQVTPLSPTEVL